MAGVWIKLYVVGVRSPAMLNAISDAGGAALGLWTEALAFAGEHLTDGKLTAGQVGRMACHSPQAAQALISAGLWIPGEDGSLQIAGYLDQQESAADVLARREDYRAEYKARRAAAKLRQRAVRPGAPERPAGPSDHVAPGPLCGVEWCDGRYHYSHDPDDNTPRAQRSSYPCRFGPMAGKSRRSA